MAELQGQPAAGSSGQVPLTTTLPMADLKDLN